jgi:protein-disulfide isomerase
MTSETQNAGVGGAQLTLPVGVRDHALGDERAPVTLVEYGDFECPQCMQAFPIVQRIREAFSERLRFVYRHFPLTNVHLHAQRAAEASEWAAGKSAFWQMHDGLYTNAGRLADADVLALATRLGLGAASLHDAWAAHSFISRVKEDFLSGIRSGVAGTPTFFINGARHEEAWDFETLSRTIEQAEAVPSAAV